MVITKYTSTSEWFVLTFKTRNLEFFNIDVGLTFKLPLRDKVGSLISYLYVVSFWQNFDQRCCARFWDSKLIGFIGMFIGLYKTVIELTVAEGKQFERSLLK